MLSHAVSAFKLLEGELNSKTFIFGEAFALIMWRGEKCHHIVDNNNKP